MDIFRMQQGDILENDYFADEIFIKGFLKGKKSSLIMPRQVRLLPPSPIWFHSTFIAHG